MTAALVPHHLGLQSPPSGWGPGDDSQAFLRIRVTFCPANPGKLLELWCGGWAKQYPRNSEGSVGAELQHEIY